MAHLWGLMHSEVRSEAQSTHAQYALGLWWLDWSWFLILADMFTRSATVDTPCLWMRHLVALVRIAASYSSTWYHAGRSRLIMGQVLMAARFVW